MVKNNYLDNILLNFSSKSIPLDKHEQLVQMELLTIKQVFEQFPVVTQVFKWSEEDIRVLYESHLLIGKIEDDVLFIEESSLKKLIEYRNKVK